MLLNSNVTNSILEPHLLSMTHEMLLPSATALTKDNEIWRDLLLLFALQSLLQLPWGWKQYLLVLKLCSARIFKIFPVTSLLGLRKYIAGLGFPFVFSVLFAFIVFCFYFFGGVCCCGFLFCFCFVFKVPLGPHLNWLEPLGVKLKVIWK